MSWLCLDLVPIWFLSCFRVFLFCPLFFFLCLRSPAAFLTRGSPLSFLCFFVCLVSFVANMESVVLHRHACRTPPTGTGGVVPWIREIVPLSLSSVWGACGSPFAVRDVTSQRRTASASSKPAPPMVHLLCPDAASGWASGLACASRSQEVPWQTRQPSEAARRRGRNRRVQDRTKKKAHKEGMSRARPFVSLSRLARLPTNTTGASFVFF